MAAPLAQERLRNPLQITRDSVQHTDCYCEENVWKLCKYVSEERPEQLMHCYAIFISSPKKTVPMWHQRASKSIGKPVVWDYHVVLLYKHSSKGWIYDVDSTLSVPTSVQSYCDQCFQYERSDNVLAGSCDFQAFFRVIPADTYLQTLSSDRFHMRNEDGSWNAPPPPYPPIIITGVANNLDEFISMKTIDVPNDTGPGEVMDITQLRNFAS